MTQTSCWIELGHVQCRSTLRFLCEVHSREDQADRRRYTILGDNSKKDSHLVARQIWGRAEEDGGKEDHPGCDRTYRVGCSDCTSRQAQRQDPEVRRSEETQPDGEKRTLRDLNRGRCDSSAEGLISLLQARSCLRVLADSSRSRDCEADYIHNLIRQVLLHPSTVWHQFGSRDISEDHEWDHVWHQGCRLLLRRHTLSFSDNRRAHSPTEPSQEETSRRRSTVEQWQELISQESDSVLGHYHQQGWCEAWLVTGWSCRPNATVDGREWAEMVPGNGELPVPLPAQSVFSVEAPEPAAGERNRMAVGSSASRSVRQRQDIVDYSADFGRL